jgi:hypothetical protein
MQNKPNLLDALMNVKSIHTVVYENKSNLTLSKNKPKQSQFPKSPNECKLTYNKGLQKKDDFAVQKNKPNSNPISSKAKMNVNLYVIKDYENKPRLRAPGKQTQSNPISKQLQSFESAKMAQQINVLKHQNTILEKSNFLYPNRLNYLTQDNLATGTLFAYSDLRNFLCTDNKQ